MELTVYVAAYCHRGVYVDDVGFFDKEFSRFVAYLPYLGFRDDLAGAELSDGSVSYVSI